MLGYLNQRATDYNLAWMWRGMRLGIRCGSKIQLLAFLESRELREGRTSWACNREELRGDYRPAESQRSSHSPRGMLADQEISRLSAVSSTPVTLILSLHDP